MFHESGKPKIWGVVTVGERGQIAIPTKAREELKIDKGEQLVFVSKGDKFIGLIKADEMTQMLRGWLDQVEDMRKESK